MGVIFMPNHIIWQRLKCVHIHSQIMHYHTGNVYCNVVPNVHVLILLTKKQIVSIPTQSLQFFSYLLSNCAVCSTWKAYVKEQEKLSRV